MENLILYLSQKLSHFIQHLYISPSSEEKTCLSFYFPWLGPTVKAESHCSVDKASLLPRPKDGKNSQTTNQHPDWFSHSQIHDLKPVASNTGLDLSGKRGNNFATFENDVRRSTCSKVNKIRMQGTNTWKPVEWSQHVWVRQIGKMSETRFSISGLILRWGLNKSFYLEWQLDHYFYSIFTVNDQCKISAWFLTKYHMFGGENKCLFELRWDPADGILHLKYYRQQKLRQSNFLLAKSFSKYCQRSAG